jgi:hypothetical protein
VCVLGIYETLPGVTTLTWRDLKTVLQAVRGEGNSGNPLRLMMVISAVTPSGLVGRYQRLGETQFDYEMETLCLLEMYFSPEDGGSMYLRDVGFSLQVHTVLQPIRH